MVGSDFTFSWKNYAEKKGLDFLTKKSLIF